MCSAKTLGKIAQLGYGETAITTSESFRNLVPSSSLIERNEFLKSIALGKTVLHLGAVDKGFGEIASLHRNLMKVSKKVVGVDMDKGGIQECKELGIDNILEGNVEHLELVSLPESNYDVIVAGEILEHLSNPGMFLEGIKKFFSPHTQMVITTPNALALHRFLLSFLRVESQHPGHSISFSYTTLTSLLKRHGFSIDRVLYYRGISLFEKSVYPLIPWLSTGIVCVVSRREIKED